MRELPTNDLIKSVLGEDHSIPIGFRVFAEIYKFGDHFVLEDGTKSILERPDIAKERDKTQMGVGRILMMGDAAFKGENFKHWGILPEVGDYIKWEKYQGRLDTENGVDIMILEDYMVISIARNPAKSSYHNWIGN